MPSQSHREMSRWSHVGNDNNNDPREGTCSWCPVRVRLRNPPLKPKSWSPATRPTHAHLQRTEIMNTNELQSFAFAKGIAIRTTIREGQPWFIASEVCAALDIINVSQAVSALDDEDRNQIRVSSSIPGNPNRTIISEAGLYALVFRSNKPSAKAFRRWVMADVLPALRSGGVYVVGQEKVDLAAMTYNEACVHIEEMRAKVGEAEAIRWAKSREEKDARRSGFALLRGGSRRTRKAIR